MVEQELKALIIERYGSLKKFGESIDMAWTTLDGVIKRGVNKVNITNLIKICDGLNIDCESLYHGRILPKQDLLKSGPLSDKEQNHIKKYRTLDEYGKKAVDTTLENEYLRCSSTAKNEHHFIDVASAREFLDTMPVFAFGGLNFDDLDDDELIAKANFYYKLWENAQQLNAGD